MRLFVWLCIFGVLHIGFAIPIPSGPQPGSSASGDPHNQPVVIPEKKYKCPYSDCATGRNIRGFSERTDLRTHINGVHLKLKPFVCDRCNKRFGRSCRLSKHKRDVHPEPGKPDPNVIHCETCDMPIKSQYHYRTHLRSLRHEANVRKAENLRRLAGKQPAPLQGQPHSGQPLLRPEPERPALPVLPSPYQPVELHQPHGGQSDSAKPQTRHRQLPILLPIPRQSPAVKSPSLSEPSGPSSWQPSGPGGPTSSWKHF